MSDEPNPLLVQKLSHCSAKRELNYSQYALMASGIAAIAVAIWGWKRLIDKSLERLGHPPVERGEIIYRNTPLPALTQP